MRTMYWQHSSLATYTRSMTSTATDLEARRLIAMPPARLVPGIIASVFVAAISVAIGRLEERAFGRAIIEPLVLAILVGMLLRSVRGEPTREANGVRFVAKEVL